MKIIGFRHKNPGQGLGPQDWVMEVKGDSAPVYYCNGKQTHAMGNFNPDDNSLLLLKDSILEGSETASYRDKDARHKWLQQHAALTKEHTYILLHDVPFSSPSTAANFALGRAANGWTCWKNEDGKTIAELFNH